MKIIFLRVFMNVYLIKCSTKVYCWLFAVADTGFFGRGGGLNKKATFSIQFPFPCYPGSSDCTSNEISVQLVDGGSRVNIQQSQVYSSSYQLVCKHTTEPGIQQYILASSMSTYIRTRYTVVASMSTYNRARYTVVASRSTYIRAMGIQQQPVG